jgi:hypothetical protein
MFFSGWVRAELLRRFLRIKAPLGAEYKHSASNEIVKPDMPIYKYALRDIKSEKEISKYAL